MEQLKATGVKTWDFFFFGWQPFFSALTVACYGFCNIPAKRCPPEKQGMKNMLVIRCLWKQKGRENTKIYKERVALDGSSLRSAVTCPLRLFTSSSRMGCPKNLWKWRVSKAVSQNPIEQIPSILLPPPQEDAESRQHPPPSQVCLPRVLISTSPQSTC